MYEVEWLDAENPSLQRFEIQLKLPDNLGVADANGHYTMAAQLIGLTELEEYVFDEESVHEKPPRIRFIKRDSIAMNEL